MNKNQSCKEQDGCLREPSAIERKSLLMSNRSQVTNYMWEEKEEGGRREGEKGGDTTSLTKERKIQSSSYSKQKKK